MPRPSRTTRLRLLLSTLLLLAVPLGAACSRSGADDRGDREVASPTTAATPSPTAVPWQTIDGPLARCGPQPPEVTAARWHYRVLRDRAVGAVPSALAGSGRTVAVLLHQTDGGGLCGWLPYARQLADAGVAALVVDLCRYGASACRGVSDGRFTDADQTEPVRVAVEHARRELGARRVVVVGASMGGSVALMSGAVLDGVSAVADLSGPVDWPGIEVAHGGRALRVPALVAMAEQEGPDDVARARAIVRRAPAGSRLVVPDDGHGYELLHDYDGVPLPFGKELLAWIRRGPNP
ncbi:hypothetical protein GON03_18460 [Nocardioides sp. MAH-18]|uniref:Alpha/beta fold hydrolase n=1 Tax=Nocardioides agri TaxID=2682843 RepID=A0A6L6XVG0_9ACTN|nr:MULTISPECIES: hypothetical protein [unclassified Nocardioides]MBA2956326.1 hypothetical protein [Nocardioides sp. CGMCC 1.13656]MVQ51169.1 hypothetical protein [Nocardioides sp. MAH-18]